MKCPNHLLTNVAGYCAVCGTFMCESCLTVHEGNKYCAKHFKPFADKIKTEAFSKKHKRHRLIVKFVDGKKALGHSRNLNVREAGFYLECEDKQGNITGETQRILFADIKYIANVKSYTGKPENIEEQPQFLPTGKHIVIRFRDGEILEGITMQNHVPNDPRFYIIPNDPLSNKINVLVEQNAIDRIMSIEEYQAAKKAAKENPKNNGGNDPAGEVDGNKPEEPALSQEESMGDFYFETHNYPGALEEYATARTHFPHSVRLRNKTVVTLINIGIQYIKSREFPAALEYMNKALELDPKNPHAYKKAKQLRKTIEKTEKRMREYYEEQEQKKKP